MSRVTRQMSAANSIFNCSIFSSSNLYDVDLDVLSWDYNLARDFFTMLLVEKYD